MINTLCLDFGNTRLKAAIFHGDQMIQERVLTDGSPETITGLLQEFEPQRSILASVINHDPEIESLLDNQTKFHKLSALTKL
ncbi:MAG TPA: type III pantothenate kinase, partial [Chitinophagaceae bacterium]|nr:type III pantothenate kinase [Chitinophagaceae bacterium]